MVPNHSHQHGTPTHATPTLVIQQVFLHSYAVITPFTVPRENSSMGDSKESLLRAPSPTPNTRPSNRSRTLRRSRDPEYNSPYEGPIAPSAAPAFPRKVRLSTVLSRRCARRKISIPTPRISVSTPSILNVHGQSLAMAFC